MTRGRIVGGAIAAALGVLALIAIFREPQAPPQQLQQGRPAEPISPGPPPEVHHSFIYGRVTTHGGAVYEGRLRWGGDEEAFWGDYFNGRKLENRWAEQVAPERLLEKQQIEILGVELGERERPIELDRPFMVRFGDIARIDASAGLQVTLKNGTVFELDRMAADDLGDGVRVWDGSRGVVNLGEREIRLIELSGSARPGAAPERLHGTVRTQHGSFTGFIQWDREAGLGSDELRGEGGDGPLSQRFDGIRSIERASRDGALVTLDDASEIALEVESGKRGSYVDDPRYGRVLVRWPALERIDFSDGGEGPAYDDYPPGRPLTGSVTTDDGRRLAGRLVFDLDESETTETLDAPFEGVDYTLPFGRVASIEPRGTQGAVVTLDNGEALQLEAAGDLGDGNAGMLVFVEGADGPEYVPWGDVARVDFE